MSEYSEKKTHSSIPGTPTSTDSSSHKYTWQEDHPRPRDVPNFCNPACRIFFKDIPEACTWKNLKYFGATGGIVVCASVNLNLKTGFLRYNTPEEASRAYEILLERKLLGTVVNMRLGRERDYVYRNYSRNQRPVIGYVHDIPKHYKKTRIVVNNIHFSATANELYDLFSEVGVVESVDVLIHPSTRRSQGMAFIVFCTPESVYAAIRKFQNFNHLGRSLVVGDDGMLSIYNRQSNLRDTRNYLENSPALLQRQYAAALSNLQVIHGLLTKNRFFL